MTLTEQIDRHMRGRGWTHGQPATGSISDLRSVEHYSPDLVWRVTVVEGKWWAIEKWSSYKDGGMYRTEADGERFGGEDSFVSEVVSLGALPWECPNCGEAGGEPRTASWTEWQGCAEHGGVVEFAEERCSKCIRGVTHRPLVVAQANSEEVPF